MELPPPSAIRFALMKNTTPVTASITAGMRKNRYLIVGNNIMLQGMEETKVLETLENLQWGKNALHYCKLFAIIKEWEMIYEEFGGGVFSDGALCGELRCV